MIVDPDLAVIMFHSPAVILGICGPACLRRDQAATVCAPELGVRHQEVPGENIPIVVFISKGYSFDCVGVPSVYNKVFFPGW